MSQVTGVLLTVGLSTGMSGVAPMTAVNAWLAAHGWDQLTLDRARESNGSKHPQVYAYLAGYNGFGVDVDEFIELVKAQPWDDGCVLVVWPEDAAITVWHVDSEYL